MGTDVDDNAFARQISEYKGQRLRYFDHETGEEKEGIFEGIWTHQETKRLVAHFKRSNVLTKILLAPKKVPLRHVLLPSHERVKETRCRSAESRHPASSRNSRPQTRSTFQYYSHFYTVTSISDFKVGDEVVWCKYSSDETTCLGKVVVTAERDDVLDGLNYQEVAIVQFDTKLTTPTGAEAPGYYAYLSGVNYTFVVPMKELLTLPEWISIRTTEEENGWTKVESRRKGKQGQHQQKTDFQPSHSHFQKSHEGFQPRNFGSKESHGSKEPSTSKKSVYFQDDHVSKVQDPIQQTLFEFTPKWEDEWQFPLNKAEFFKELEKNNGNEMGIQGNNNSCYMDSSLFALFAFNETLDNSLLQFKSDSAKSINCKLKRVIRDSIIFPMRHRPYVPHEHVSRLRKILAKNVREDYLSRYMDVEEFLTDLFKLMDIPPFLLYDNDEGDYIHQITLPFTWEENQYQPYLTLQSLLENSFNTFDVKLKNRPEGVFILKLPISDGVLIPCKGVIPNLTLDLSGILRDPGNATSHNRTMNLHAVICLKQNHFVVFVRTGKEDSSPWVLMDSNPTNQRPYVSVLPDVDIQILQAVDQVESEMPPKSIKYEPVCKNFALFRNAYVCIYV